MKLLVDPRNTSHHVMPSAALTCNERVNVDWTSTVIQVLDYYPYGSTRINQTTNNFAEGKQFIAQYSDPETNLSYLQARYYDGSKGQFLSEDPDFLGDPKQQMLTDPQSLNSYSYGNDNPVVKSDPNGRLAVEAAAGALIGGGVGIASQGMEDFIAGRLSGLDAYASQAAGGLVAGAIIGATDGLSLVAAASGGVAAGAAGGATKSVTQQTINSAGGPLMIDATAVRTDALLGGEFGLIPGLRELPGFNGRGALNPITRMLSTKLENGSIQNSAGPESLNKNSASISGTSTLVMLPRGIAAL